MANAVEVPRCEFEAFGDQCAFASRFLVMTQIPPYTQAHTCHEHLPMFIDRFLGHELVPIIVRRVRVPEDWTWS